MSLNGTSPVDVRVQFCALSGAKAEAARATSAIFFIGRLLCFGATMDSIATMALEAGACRATVPRA